MLNDSSLEAVKHNLNKKLVELEERARSAARHLSSLHSSDSAEQAQERENDDVLAAIKQESIEEIRDIRKALQRIDEGEYGVCARCEGAIPQARLKVLPYATLCIKCAEEDERR